MKRGTTVAVLMGGKTPEHEISLISGREVVRNLPKKYKVTPIVITKDGKKWLKTTKAAILSADDPLKLHGTKENLKLPRSAAKQINIKDIAKYDVCFVAMHGPFGEDGTVQGLLEMVGVPFTGPGVLASSLAMNKIVFRKLLYSAGLTYPKYVVAEKGKRVSGVKNLGRPPYFIKPSDQGSSVGASIAKSAVELRESVAQAHKYSNLAMVDEYIEGMEVTCGVLGNKNPKPLPLVEIKPLLGEFFDYDSKYKDGGAEEIVPARISKGLTRKVQDMAVEVYKLLNCRGFSRVDFILKGKSLYVLEVNTIPGLTPMSLLPRAAKAGGYTYSKLLDTVVKYALE